MPATINREESCPKIQRQTVSLKGRLESSLDHQKNEEETNIAGNGESQKEKLKLIEATTTSFAL